MALYLDNQGQLVESDESPERLAENGFTPAGERDLERALSNIEYEERPTSGKVAETIRTGLDAAARPVLQGMDAIGLDVGFSRDEHGNMVDPEASPGKLFDDQARFATERHPVASMAGQAFAVAPLALTPGGMVAGVLGEAAAGGVAAEAENAWLEDREFSQEAAFLNVGAGLLVGGGVMGAAAGGKALSRLGRNLFTEGEHAAGKRAARDLLDAVPSKAGAKSDIPSSADDIAARGADDPAVSYMRDNADELTSEIANKQAKAAQDILDTYGEVARLRPDPDQVAASILDMPLEQARWVTATRDAVSAELDELPAEVAAPLRERLAKLAEGDDPARWFTRASELSDDLQRAKTRAAKIDAEAPPPEPLDGAPAPAPAAPVAAADRVTRAKALLDAGLKDEGLWGAAARTEGQRAASYTQRYGGHIEAFENAFSTEIRGVRRADPERFKALLDDATRDPQAAKALDDTLESARVTADVAAKFGRKAEAQKILAAVETIERTQGQVQAVAAARKTVARATPDPVASALEWLTREGSKAAVEEGVDTAFKGGGAALGGMVGGPVGMAAGWLGGRYLSKKLGDSVVSGVSNAAAEAAASRLANRSAVFRGAQGMAKVLAHGNRRGVQKLLARPLEGVERASKAVQSAAPPTATVTALNYDATRDHIEKMATDPAYFGEVMAASFGTMPEAAPEVYGALSEQAAKVAQYLSAVAPGGKGGGPFGERFPVSEDELWEFNERMRAVTDPEFVRSELAAGRLSSQAIEAFEMMNPKAYAKLQRDVFERLAELQQLGVPVTVQAREQIDVLLNIDGGGDPALTWKVAERAALAQQRKDAMQSSNGSFETERPEAMTSGALSTLGNGAAAVAQTG